MIFAVKGIYVTPRGEFMFFGWGIFFSILVAFFGIARISMGIQSKRSNQVEYTCNACKYEWKENKN